MANDRDTQEYLAAMEARPCNQEYLRTTPTDSGIVTDEGLVERLLAKAPTVNGRGAVVDWPNNPDGSEAADRILALTRTLADERKLLDNLQQAEAAYRLAHDLHGDGALAAGRAWDAMRRAGDAARASLSQRPTDGKPK